VYLYLCGKRSFLILSCCTGCQAEASFLAKPLSATTSLDRAFDRNANVMIACIFVVLALLSAPSSSEVLCHQHLHMVVKSSMLGLIAVVCSAEEVANSGGGGPFDWLAKGFESSLTVRKLLS
jgi:hypothetical protein